jgi:hypothetical protein
MIDNYWNKDINSVLFPVESRPIFYPSDSLFDQNLKEMKRYKAIVDVERDAVLAVVSKNYQLLTNKDAIALGEQCFKGAFPESSEKEMQLIRVSMPHTRTFCHLDFIKEDGGFEPFTGDRWHTFLRITNSYNRSKQLGFALGFYREICSNGMIMSNDRIAFNFVHTRKEIDMAISFIGLPANIRSLEIDFTSTMQTLESIHIPEEAVFPMVCKFLDVALDRSDMDKPRRMKRFLKFKAQITYLREKYFHEMGANAYSLLNVLTEYATDPSLSISSAVSMDQLQRRCWSWTSKFLEEASKPRFNIETYVEKYHHSAAIIDEYSSIHEV